MANMSRQHFQFIADTLRNGNRFVIEADRHLVALNFADALRSTNPNFKRDRFLRACGFED